MGMVLLSGLKKGALLRSSHPEVLGKKSALINFTKLRHQVCKFIKKEHLTQVFSCKFCEIFKSTFLWNTSGCCFCLFTKIWSLTAKIYPNLWLLVPLSFLCLWIKHTKTVYIVSENNFYMLQLQNSIYELL